MKRFFPADPHARASAKVANLRIYIYIFVQVHNKAEAREKINQNTNDTRTNHKGITCVPMGDTQHMNTRTHSPTS